MLGFSMAVVRKRKVREEAGRQQLHAHNVQCNEIFSGNGFETQFRSRKANNEILIIFGYVNEFYLRIYNEIVRMK